MAEQFAPVLPEFQYLPSDAKFMGDPVDYIILMDIPIFAMAMVRQKISILFCLM